MTNLSTPTEKETKTCHKKTKDTQQKTSITQRLQTDLGRSVGLLVSTASSGQKADGVPTYNLRGRGSGPCRL